MKTLTIKGNLLTLASEGKFHAIAHGCNAYHTMGAGIAKQIAQKWPSALRADKSQTQKGDPSKLGTFSKTSTTDKNGNPFYIFNLYTQFHWGQANKNPLERDTQPKRLQYIANAFKTLGIFLNSPENQLLPLLPKEGFQLGIPLIGAGLAGGDWNQILPAIEEGLENTHGTLTVVEFQP